MMKDFTMAERFYNGRILGMSEYSDDDISELNGVMAWLQS